MSVLIETSMGDITVDLFTDKCPEASRNFLKLAKLKYYHFGRFAQVQRDFLAVFTHPFKVAVSLSQLKGKSQYFKDEITPNFKIDRPGLMLTANKGPHMNNSEFCLTLSANRLKTLEGKHSVFGEVVEGLDVVQLINEAHLDQRDRPLMHISILHCDVIDDPFEDPAGHHDPPSPEPEDYLQNIKYGEDYANKEKVFAEAQDSGALEQSIMKHRTKAKEVVLEMLNDIPDADMRPPDTVLFVCKLNPLTTDEDLESIFSQYGKIRNCEIVKDWKTLESLQYAFIEYETREECEEAYFKMNNCLVDDRRIHVDFSQSMQHKSRFNFVRNRKREFYKEMREGAGEGKAVGLETVAEERVVQEPGERYGRESDRKSRRKKRKKDKKKRRIRKSDSSRESRKQKRKKKRKKKEKDKKSKRPKF